MKYGSPHVRQSILKSIASDYYVVDKKLVVDWVSPFKERAEGIGCSMWLPLLDGMRTTWMQDIRELDYNLQSLKDILLPLLLVGKK